MGGEVDDQQAPARRQHARRLAHGALRIAQEVQHLVHDNGADALVGERQIVDVALAHMGAAGLAALELGAGVGQHGRAQVDAEAAAIAVAEQLQHAPRAGAEVDEQIERAGAQHLGHHGFHVAPRPRAGRGCGPTRRRGPGSRPVPPSRAPRAGRRRDGGRGRAGHPSRSTASSTRRASAPPSPPSPSRKYTQLPSGARSTRPASASSLQMPADARLALPQDAREVLDVELARGQQHQQAQPRRLGHRLQGSHAALNRQSHPHLHEILVAAYKDIFMCQAEIGLADEPMRGCTRMSDGTPPLRRCHWMALVAG